MRDLDVIREEAGELAREGTELRDRLARWQQRACALITETADATVTQEGNYDQDMAAFLGLDAVEELHGDLNDGEASPKLTV